MIAILEFILTVAPSDGVLAVLGLAILFAIIDSKKGSINIQLRMTRDELDYLARYGRRRRIKHASSNHISQVWTTGKNFEIKRLIPVDFLSFII